MKALYKIAGFCLSIGLWAQPIKAQDYNPNLLIFTAELDHFVEQSAIVKGKTSDDPEVAKILEDLMQTALRISRVYFQEADEKTRPELDGVLGAHLRNNRDLRNYFIMIGNAFLIEAENMFRATRERQKRIRIYAGIGGAVVGLAVGGGYLYVKSRLLSSSLKAQDYLISAGAVVGFSALGYGGGYLAKYYLPVDRAISNARDFAARYPNGEDYIKQIESPDLQWDVMDSEEN